MAASKKTPEVEQAIATRFPSKKARFLEALGKSPNVSRAAQWVGVDRRTPYNWRSADPEFAAQWDDARESGVDELEARALELATAGDSPALTIFMLKSLRPATYSDRARIELTGANGGPIQVVELPTSAERAAELARILSEAGTV